MAYQIRPALSNNGVKHLGTKMHYAEGMLQSGVGCPGINLVCQAELTDAPQSLECRVIDNLLFPAVKRNKSMDRSRTTKSGKLVVSRIVGIVVDD